MGNLSSFRSDECSSTTQPGASNCLSLCPYRNGSGLDRGRQGIFTLPLSTHHYSIIINGRQTNVCFVRSPKPLAIKFNERATGQTECVRTEDGPLNAIYKSSKQKIIQTFHISSSFTSINQESKLLCVFEFSIAGYQALILMKVHHEGHN